MFLQKASFSCLPTLWGLEKLPGEGWSWLVRAAALPSRMKPDLHVPTSLLVYPTVVYSHLLRVFFSLALLPVVQASVSALSGTPLSKYPNRSTNWRCICDHPGLSNRIPFDWHVSLTHLVMYIWNIQRLVCEISERACLISVRITLMGEKYLPYQPEILIFVSRDWNWIHISASSICQLKFLYLAQQFWPQKKSQNCVPAERVQSRKWIKARATEIIAYS